MLNHEHSLCLYCKILWTKQTVSEWTAAKIPKTVWLSTVKCQHIWINNPIIINFGFCTFLFYFWVVQLFNHPIYTASQWNVFLSHIPNQIHNNTMASHWKYNRHLLLLQVYSFNKLLNITNKLFWKREHDLKYWIIYI